MNSHLNTHQDVVGLYHSATYYDAKKRELAALLTTIEPAVGANTSLGLTCLYSASPDEWATIGWKARIGATHISTLVSFVTMTKLVQKSSLLEEQNGSKLIVAISKNINMFLSWS